MGQYLEADGIRLVYDNRAILSDIYLRCETGKITGLLGRNGQGKTSLIEIIAGLRQPESKSLRVNKQAFLSGLPHHVLTYLPQSKLILPHKRVGEAFDDYGLPFGAFADCFSLNLSAGERVGQLSGGQRRLLEVYLVTMLPSAFSLLDEPFSYLMPLHVEALKALLQTQKAHKGFLITDHQYRHVLNVADTLYLLSGGKTHAVTDQQQLDDLGYIRLDS